MKHDDPIVRSLIVDDGVLDQLAKDGRYSPYERRFLVMIREKLSTRDANAAEAIQLGSLLQEWMRR